MFIELAFFGDQGAYAGMSVDLRPGKSSLKGRFQLTKFIQEVQQIQLDEFISQTLRQLSVTMMFLRISTVTLKTVEHLVLFAILF